MWNMQSYPTTVLNERMWHFRGSKHTLTPPTYFQEVRTPNPHDLRPWLHVTVQAVSRYENIVDVHSHLSTFMIMRCDAARGQCMHYSGEFIYGLMLSAESQAAFDLWITKQVCAAAATTLRLQIAIAMYSRSNCVTNNYAVVMFVCDHRFWIEGNLVRQPVTELTNWKVLMSSDLVQITLNVTCNFVSNLKFEYLSNEQGRSQRGGQGGQSHPNPS